MPGTGMVLASGKQETRRDYGQLLLLFGHISLAQHCEDLWVEL